MCYFGLQPASVMAYRVAVTSIWNSTAAAVTVATAPTVKGTPTVPIANGVKTTTSIGWGIPVVTAFLAIATRLERTNRSVMIREHASAGRVWRVPSVIDVK